MKGLKRCNSCQIEKEMSFFHRRSDNSGGVRSDCVACYRKKMNAKWVKTRAPAMNEEERKIRQKESARRHNATPERKARQAFYQATRRFLKSKATPKWLTDRQRAAICAHYETANALTREFKIQMDVDHVVPLKGKNVCGLHVPWNLQVLAHEANSRKSNSYEN